MMIMEEERRRYEAAAGEKGEQIQSLRMAARIVIRQPQTGPAQSCPGFVAGAKGALPAGAAALFAPRRLPGHPADPSHNPLVGAL